MSLSSASATAEITWLLQKSNTPFNPTKQGADSRSFNLTVPAGVTSVLATQLSLASGTNSDVNFESFTDLAGNAITATKLYGLIVIPDIGATNPGGIITVAKSASNGIAGTPFDTTGSPVTAPGSIFWVQTTPITLSSVLKNLNFAASGGGTTTADIVALVGA